MADPMTWGAVSIGASTILSAGSQFRMGEKAYEQGLVQKALNDVAATQAVAIGQRNAAEARKATTHVAKRALAIAAAGGSADDIDMLAADIEGMGSYNAAVALNDAETTAEKLKYEGKQYKKEGKQQFVGANIAAGNTLLSGGLKLASMYVKPGEGST